MELRSDPPLSFVRMTLTETESHYYPSARYDVAAELEGLHVVRWAWFDATAIGNFVTDLRRLDATRTGSATIESMSPGEFVLTLRATDRLGHVEVAVSVSKWTPSLEWSVKSSFPVHPSCLQEVSREFEDLLRSIS